MTTKNQKALQAKVNGEWQYVFCNNTPNGLVTTETRKKALHGETALNYFQDEFADVEFRLVRGEN